MSFCIGDKLVGEGGKVFIIAELSANHLQNYKLAVDTIKAARDAGATAVKFQTYTPDTITINCDKDYFKIKHGTVWDGRTLYDLYQEAHTPWEWQEKLNKVACDLGLICFSSVFDKSSVDFLEAMNMPAYKIASFEITDIPLIEYVASKNKPVIISTGIASLEDIKDAVEACKNKGNNKIALLKCTSSYPAQAKDLNLKAMVNLAETFDVMVGLSDHSLLKEADIAAVALGAKIIEKHIILDRTLGGPDAAFSLEPHEFKEMVDSIRLTEEALGEKEIKLSNNAKKSREFCRSLFVVEDVKKGEIFTEKNIRSIRPGYGLMPKFYKEILGKKAACDIERGTPLSWDLAQ